MIVAVEDNPNCTGCGVMRFEVRSLPRRVQSVPYHGDTDADTPLVCRVTGWGPEGPTPAVTQKVLDSGDGVAWLVRGGEWGLRLGPASATGPWSLEADDQWGEPYLLVDDDREMIFE